MHARRPMRLPQRQRRRSVRARHEARGRQQWVLSSRAVHLSRGDVSPATGVPQVRGPEDQ